STPATPVATTTPPSPRPSSWCEACPGCALPAASPAPSSAAPSATASAASPPAAPACSRTECPSSRSCPSCWPPVGRGGWGCWRPDLANRLSDQGQRRVPGPPRAGLVVGEAGASRHPRNAEPVRGTTVDVVLPVGPGGGHLALERRPVLGRA